MSDWVVGVDLGGTKIALGLINPDNEIVARRRIPTQVEDGPQAAVERMAESIFDMAQELPSGQKMAALGICSPGPVEHETGVIINPPNLPTFHNTPFRQMLSNRLHIPVCLEHDAKAAALGELYYGAGKGETSLVYIVVGTGVGAAIIINGEIIRGQRNYAGEVGHITLDRNGDLCHCGSRGCAETYLSGPRLGLRYRRACKPEPDSAWVTGEQVAELAQEGDPLARRIILEAGESLGVLVSMLAMTLDVELYIIGGSVVKCGDIFLQPARETVPKYSFPSVAPRVRIVGAALGEDGPMLGGAWLARQALEDNC